MSLLQLENLEVHYEMEGAPVRAVDDVTFDLREGENLGIVGESGCGKSTLAQAILGNLPNNGKIAGGSIEYDGIDLTELTAEERRPYKWEEISMIPQSAMNALDPVYTVREQIIEAVEAHRRGVDKARADKRVDELFELVGLDPSRAGEYPHQFSGGMRQRAMIAMALVLEPSLILADEPTTALDVIMQDQILKRINKIQDEINSSILVITHDVSVVAETCDRVLVMYAGQVVEEGPVEDIFNQPYHPYTVGLGNAFPNIRMSDQELVSIPGYPPELQSESRLSGCRFAERCPIATEKCFSETPPEVENGDLRSKCHHTNRVDTELRPHADELDTWMDTEAGKQMRKQNSDNNE